MSLPDFFKRLIVIVEASSIPPEINARGYESNIEKEVIKSHLNFLRLRSEQPEDQWHRHQSAIKSSWTQVLSRTKGMGFFDEFRGDEELRAKLKHFLGETI